jgi:hypothetical protein
MTQKTKLRVFVCIEAACIICTLILAIFGDGLLPAELREYEQSASKSSFKVTDCIRAALLLVLLPAALTATIGLFFSWRPARFLFLWTRAVVVLCSPLFAPSVDSGWGDLFDGAAILVAGVVIGMLYFSELKDLYDKPTSAA